MSSLGPFSARGVWLKAALHQHSTASDGLLSPEAVIEHYERAGYGVVAITDHNKLTLPKGVFNCVVIPGVEVTARDSRYHVVVLGVREEPRMNLEAQEIIDWAVEREGIAIIAHPYWSSLGCEELVRLEGYTAIEVYNTGCDIEVAKGDSSVYWDYLLARGRLVFGVAVDDAHRYTSPPTDSLGGWTLVKAREANEEEVLRSLKEGLFYSSMGPELYELSLSRDTLSMSASPVWRIDLVSRNGTGLSISTDILSKLIEGWRNKDRGVTSILEELMVEDYGDDVKVVEIVGSGKVTLTLRIRGTGIEKLMIKGVRKLVRDYLRIVLTDHYGKRAWSNPLRL